MPPKLRRPAAAVAVAKAGLRRGQGLRRPAAGGEAGDAGDEAGEIDCSQISLEECQNLKEVEVVSGSYWEAPLKAALRVSEVKLKDGQKMIGAQVLGTQCEGLLKWASGQPDRVVRGHLCPKDCPGTPHEDGLLHIRKLRRLEAAREEWMTNMLPEERRGPGEDELAELRADKRKHHQDTRGEGVRGLEKASESPPRKRRKTEKKRSRSRRGRSSRFKLEGRKDIAVVLGATGADPNPKMRRKCRKKAARIARRKSKGSSGESTGSSSGSTSSLSEDRALFGSMNRVHTIGRRLPGVLLTAALEEASDALVTQEGGIYDVQGGTLPPLFSRYFKQNLATKMSPAMRREAQTLAHMLDLGLRGRVAECLDVGAQRLKALEMMMSGVHYTVAQQTELLPKEEISMSSVPEFTEAARRAREDGRARLEASRPYGTRGSAGAKSEEWVKGGGKKGQPKGKGGKSDQKKGDGDKADPKRAKGG